MKKLYILDTSVLIYDTNSIFNFEDNDIIITSITQQELNKLKELQNNTGQNARKINRILDKLTEKYGVKNINLSDKENKRGFLNIEYDYLSKLKDVKKVLGEINNDRKILSIALKKHEEYTTKKKSIEMQIELLKKEKVNIKSKEKLKEIEKQLEQLKEDLNNLKPVIVVTKDVSMRIDARMLNLVAQDYISDNVIELYEGWRIIKVKDEVLMDYYNQKLYYDNHVLNQKIPLSEIESIEYDLDFDLSKYIDIDKYNLKPNEYVVLLSENVDIENMTKEEIEREIYKDINLPIFRYDVKQNKLLPIKVYKYLQLFKPYHIFPRNIHQLMLVDMMFDRKRTFKTANGIAGTGKTLMILLSAIIQTNDLRWYDNIIITRPLIDMEEKTGILPGDELDKIEPYMRPFIDNLKFITYRQEKGNNEKKRIYNELDFKNNIRYILNMYNITPVSPSYLRGTTHPRSIILIDEGQNGTKHWWETATTRIGENSIYVGFGDIEQIDHPYLSKHNNGLAFTVEMMKDEDIAMHVTLPLSERSEIAKIIANKWKEAKKIKEG